MEKNNNFTTSLNAQQNRYQNGWSIIVLLLHATSNLSVRNRISHAFLEFNYSWRNWWKKPSGYSSGLWGFLKINFEIILICCFEQGPLMYCRLRTEFNINMYSPLNGCWCSLSPTLLNYSPRTTKPTKRSIVFDWSSVKCKILISFHVKRQLKQLQSLSKQKNCLFGWNK